MKRVQRQRTKGYRLPPDTVCVSRPSRWGNPFPVGRPGPLMRTAPDQEGAVGLFEDMLDDPEMRALCEYPSDDEIREQLRGKNLACWCPIISPSGYVPCHADVLLSLANDIPMEEVKRENTRRAKGETL